MVSCRDQIGKEVECLRWGVHLEVKFVCSRRAKRLIGEGSEDSCYAATKSPRLSHGTGNRRSEWLFGSFWDCSVFVFFFVCFLFSLFVLFCWFLFLFPRAFVGGVIV